MIYDGLLGILAYKNRQKGAYIPNKSSPIWLQGLAELLRVATCNYCKYIGISRAINSTAIYGDVT